MPVTLQYPSKCVLCREGLAPGTTVNWIADESGSGFSHAHITCPDPGQKTIRERRPIQEIDHDELFVIRECSKCGLLWTFKKDGLKASSPTRRCPTLRTERMRDEQNRVSYEEVVCNGEWERDLREGWAI